MIDRRINIANDNVDFLKTLLASEDGKGPFKLQVDVLAFAASLGASRNKSVPLGDTAKDPIRYDIFERNNYDKLFNLLAIYSTNDPQVLSNADEMIDKRATIFEEYANGGLELMQQQFKGAYDYLNEISLLISSHRKKYEGKEEEFDLGKILE